MLFGVDDRTTAVAGDKSINFEDKVMEALICYECQFLGMWKEPSIAGDTEYFTCKNDHFDAVQDDEIHIKNCVDFLSMEDKNIDEDFD